MHLAERPLLRIAFLALMYVAQGLPWGFVSVALVAYLATTGATTADIGRVMAMAMAPWPFKWAFGPLVDRFTILSMGRRRPWIILAQSLMVLTTFCMILIPDLTADIWVLGLVLMVHNVFVSLQDVAVDALAVDLLHGPERERASGIMYGASYVGTFLGGAGLGIMIGVWSFHAALVTLVAAQLAIVLFPLLVRERRGEKLLPWTAGRAAKEVRAADNASVWDLTLRVAWAFSLRSTLLAALLALLVLSASALTSVMATTYIIQQVGWSQQHYSAVAGGGGVLLGLFGSLVGGFLASTFGARWMACTASVGLGLTWIIFAMFLSPEIHRHAIAAYLYIEVIFLAMMTVSLFALFMRVSWPLVAATQFTAYMAMLNVSRMAGAAAAGNAAGWVTTPQAFMIAGLVQIALIGLIMLVDPTQTRRVLGELELSGQGAGGKEETAAPTGFAEIESRG